MAETQQVDPVAEPTPLKIEGKYLAIASPTSVSEACFSVPAVRAIQQARPDDTLVILAPANIAPIWRKVPGIDQILTYQPSDSPRKLAKILNECGLPFDSSIVWDKSPAALAFVKSGIQQRLGYPTKKLGKLLTHPVQVVRNIGPVEHQVNHYLLFVYTLGIDPLQPSNFETPERPAPGQAFRVAIVPGSDFGPASEWPLPSFVELARAIAQQCELVIIPSPGRPQPADALAKELGNAALVNSLEGDELIDFLATCQGLVGNDGSLPHLASLVGTPSLVLFGPNEPEWKRPLGKIHRILHHREACSGCRLAKCPLDHRCLVGISLAEALEELRILFKG
ncbi:MAG: glycosyltransferase family 9 protein [Akkermansiaceae bacterium]|jgi:heptosyltransferase-2